MKFELEGKSFKERLIIAHKIFEEKVLPDLMNGRIPTYHIVHFEDTVEGSIVTNHYLTPLSLEPIDDKKNRMLWVQDFEFLLSMLLTDERVKRVEYNDERPAVIIDFYANLDIGELMEGEK